MCRLPNGGTVTTKKSTSKNRPAKKPAAKKPAAKKAARKGHEPAARVSKAGSRVRTRSGKQVGWDKASALYGKYFFDTKVRGYDLRTDLGVASAIESGVSTKAVEDVIESGIVEPGVLYEFVVPRRTLAHRKAKDQRLTSEESDRLARVLRVYARSEDALGDPDRAYRWLRKPNRALGGKTPLELLSSEAGARAVEKVLGRLEHGVFS
jgi:putative toxin-antitoxin system antitoxin component (TIGR02293 family)